MLPTLGERKNREAKVGFTLIELMVVITIIGILGTFAALKAYHALTLSKDAGSSMTFR